MLISDADNCNIDVDLLKSNVALRSANLWYLKECWPDAIMSEIKNRSYIVIIRSLHTCENYLCAKHTNLRFLQTLTLKTS
ncbi:hypothetical protein RclHR1_08930004 [Rhizophagus clarus]|uniref:Uncharacterized protein n=1 Tax=Rhizophagus clarus TaxID=94130 RepID=A0A2Z6S4U9_9GLOM|nr:hypothetical protein RclHR1_08930004 [Rhizophagus clarus]